MAISAAMVKELREISGAGMMDAKNALVENNGDIEEAMNWLRTKGLAKAAKKAGRVAAEGLVGVAEKDGVAVLVEINSETDFVARNSEFQDMCSKIAKAALEAEDLDALQNVEIDGVRTSDVLTEKIAKIGENLTLRRMKRVIGKTLASYVHSPAAEGLGAIGVIVALEGEDKGIGKQIAMHIAASNPAALDEASLDPALVEREKAVLTEQARESGKPDNVIEKMIEGRIRKFFGEVTLLGQPFVMNQDLSVAKAAEEAGVKITDFAYFKVGDGVDKSED